MASINFTDPLIYLHGYDLTGDLKQVELSIQADELDNTTFGNGGYKSRVGGLKTVALSGDGFWQGAPDAEIGPNLGVADRVVTISPSSAEGDTAYITQVGHFSYDVGGGVADLMPFKFQGSNTSPQGSPRGQIAKKKGNVSATGALGTGLNLGAVGATSYLYASFHVFTAGTTITVLVESDDNSGFTTPTTRATIGPITTTGGTWAVRVAGAIADSYYRFKVSAVTGTFSVAGAIAIQ